jgi:hypothetical protein
MFPRKLDFLCFGLFLDISLFLGVVLFLGISLFLGVVLFLRVVLFLGVNNQAQLSWKNKIFSLSGHPRNNQTILIFFQ